MADTTANGSPLSPKRVFGLGIDEKVQWVVAEATSPVSSYSDKFEWGTFDIDIAGPPKGNALDLGLEIRKALTGLKKDRPDLFEGIEGLGVSTIGVVNQKSKRLRSIARKSWIKHSPNIPNRDEIFVIDFRILFDGFFDKSVIDSAEVYNDATAKALVEYNLDHIGENNKDDTLLLLMFTEGVNGGIIYGQSPLPSLLHPEMGHIRPRPHRIDIDTSAGEKFCPAHKVCFEALASSGRIRESWGPPDAPSDFNISDLPDTHIAWEVIAWYISQLCMIGTLLLAPKHILLSGSVITGRDGDEKSRERSERLLIPLIRSYFTEMNNEYLFYAEMNEEKFLRPARIANNPNVVAALQIARLSAYPQFKSLPVGKWKPTVIHGDKR